MASALVELTATVPLAWADQLPVAEVMPLVVAAIWVRAPAMWAPATVEAFPALRLRMAAAVPIAVAAARRVVAPVAAATAAVHAAAVAATVVAHAAVAAPIAEVAAAAVEVHPVVVAAAMAVADIVANRQSLSHTL